MPEQKSLETYWIHHVYIYLIEHYWHFLSTYIFVNPFKLLYQSNGIWWELASLDVENLFTNVPVNETIDIINNIYNNPSLLPFKINPNIFWEILLICTSEVPFPDHLGNIYIQTDGVFMGSILGPIFSNFHMSDFENRIFNSIRKPSIYLRYVDDIFILANDINEINIQDAFQKIQFLTLLMN